MKTKNICKECKKSFNEKRHNQIFCCGKCKQNYNNLIVSKKRWGNVKPCELCGFNKITQRHHIIKQLAFGSDDEENIVLLCPNCHVMADTSYYEKDMRNLIFKKTGKKGKEER